MFKPVYSTYITILLISQVMCLIVKMQNMFFGYLKLHIPDVFNCDSANIMWNTRTWGGINKTFEFILAQTCICRCRVNQYLIVLNLYSVSVSKVLVTEYITVKVSQNLNLMLNMSTQWNQQHSRSVFSKVIKCLEQNIGKQVDKKRLSSTKQMNRVQNICIEYANRNITR